MNRSMIKKSLICRMKGRSAPSLSPCLSPSLCMHPTRKPSLIPRGRDRPTDVASLPPSFTPTLAAAAVTVVFVVD